MMEVSRALDGGSWAKALFGMGILRSYPTTL